MSSFDNLIKISLQKFNLDKEKELLEDIRRLLEDNFKNKEFSRFFSFGPEDEAYNEKEIVDENGGLKRVDRILIRKDRIEVVDFKTGEEDKEKHVEQISGYIDLIKELYPGKKVEGYLCYLDDLAVKEVKQ